MSLGECHQAVCRYAECRYAECRYAECRQAECRYAGCRYAECQQAECHALFINMLNAMMLTAIILTGIMLKVVMLSVVMLNVVMLIVVAPLRLDQCQNITLERFSWSKKSIFLGERKKKFLTRVSLIGSQQISGIKLTRFTEKASDNINSIDSEKQRENKKKNRVGSCPKFFFFCLKRVLD